jgi:hypothetical protein
LNKKKMRKKCFFMAIAFGAAAIIMTSCSEDREENRYSEAIQFASAIGNMAQQTRTANGGDEWVQNDAIGVFMVNHEGSNIVGGAANKRYIATGSNNTFTAAEGNALYYPVNGSAVDFIALSVCQYN